ncbi:MAG: hypothetical protein NZ108_07540, partial [Bacteroidia bacterium]|nr:hypothetical protein [Bacteroidia bacterium]
MKRIILFSLLFLWATLVCSQDKRGYFWLFGDSLSIDFKQTPIQIDTNVVHCKGERNPFAICDTAGNLLLYGGQIDTRTMNEVDSTVQNKLNYTIWLADGSILDSAFSGYWISPITFPENPGIVYLIQIHILPSGRLLLYSKLDVINRQVLLKNKYLFGFGSTTSNTYTWLRFDNGLLLKHANGRDFWHITCSYSFDPSTTSKIYKTLITPDSIIFVDSTTFCANLSYSDIVFNSIFYGHDKEGCRLFFLGMNRGIWVVDFNRNTGETSPCYTYQIFPPDTLLPTFPPPFSSLLDCPSLAYSNNGRYLYVTYNLHSSAPPPPVIKKTRIVQYDLHQPTPLLIKQTAKTVWAQNTPDSLMLFLVKAPTGKMFFYQADSKRGNAPDGTPYYDSLHPERYPALGTFSVIENPDTVYPACQVNLYAIDWHQRRNFDWFQMNMQTDYNVKPCTRQVAECGLVSDTIGSGMIRQLGIPPITGLQYSWSPTDYLSDPTISNPTITAPSLDTTITYILTVT